MNSLENWFKDQNLINKKGLAQAMYPESTPNAANVKLTQHVNGRRHNNQVAIRLRAQLRELIWQIDQELRRDPGPPH